jgi:hypothetical protein
MAKCLSWHLQSATAAPPSDAHNEYLGRGLKKPYAAAAAAELSSVPAMFG